MIIVARSQNLKRNTIYNDYKICLHCKKIKQTNMVKESIFQYLHTLPTWPTKGNLSIAYRYFYQMNAQNFSKPLLLFQWLGGTLQPLSLCENFTFYLCNATIEEAKLLNLHFLHNLGILWKINYVVSQKWIWSQCYMGLYDRRIKKKVQQKENEKSVRML